MTLNWHLNSPPLFIVCFLGFGNFSIFLQFFALEFGGKEKDGKVKAITEDVSPKETLFGMVKVWLASLYFYREVQQDTKNEG